MNGVLPIYNEIRRIATRLTRECAEGKYPGQPKPESIEDPETGEIKQEVPALWLASLHNSFHRTTPADPRAGKGICVTPFSYGCRRIAEGSHRLATEEEINLFKEYGEAQRRYHAAEDAKRASRVEIKLPETETK